MVKAIISMQIAAYLLKKAKKIEMTFFMGNRCNRCKNIDFIMLLSVTPTNKQGVTGVTNHPKPSIFLVKTYQTLLFNSFILVDAVAVRGNNAWQERQNLFSTVSHRTLADVFLCLSFSNLSFTGKLYLTLALVRLWWGGRGNKPLGANTVCRCCSGSEPPCRPTFRANNQNILTPQKGTTK